MLKRFREFLFIILSSVLLVLPYHVAVLWPFAYMAFIPYLFVLESKSSGEAFKQSYFFGLIFFILLGTWLARVNLLGFLMLAAYLALYFAVFGCLSAPFMALADDRKRLDLRKTLSSALFMASLWVALEYLRGWMISGLPWALAGYSQWRNILVIQIADLTSCYGVSFFVILTNLLLFHLVRTWVRKGSSLPIEELKPQRIRFSLGLVAALAVLIVIVCGYGAVVLHARDGFYKKTPAVTRIHISVVQGNIPQDQKWDARIKGIIFDKYKGLTFMSALERSDLIVWPETSFPGYLEDEPLMAAQLRNVVRQSRTNVLVGTPTLGEMERGLKFYNSAVLYAPSGEEAKRYDKLHLVPFGEYIPFEPLLGIIRHFVWIGSFSPGRDKTIFEIQTRYQKRNFKAKFAVLICYEDIFPGLVRTFCRGGADFLVNMTNDAWFGKTSAPYQHAQASVFRAVENRVPVVRATNTGLSCFISPEGRILSSVQQDGKEIFVAGHQGQDLVLRRTRTFYTRFGDVFVFAAILYCFLVYLGRARQQTYSHL